MYYCRASDKIEEAANVLVTPKDDCKATLETGSTYFVTGKFEEADGKTVFGKHIVVTHILTNEYPRAIERMWHRDVS